MKAARTDANQSEIVKALRATGCSVVDLSSVGMGCPDIMVGRNGVTVLMEIKTEKGKLNSIQVEWHKCWKGAAAIVRTPVEAIDAINDAVARIERGRTWNR